MGMIVNPHLAAAVLPVVTTFYKASGSITVPDGYTSARVSCWGHGGSGYGESTWHGGGGGAFAQSVISVTPGETLTATIVLNAGTSLKRAATTLVEAMMGTNAGTGGQASASTGTVKYSGGSGSSVVPETYYAVGGGAAGTAGDGSNATNTSGSSGDTTAAGPGATFTQTSDGETATGGLGRVLAGNNYGGGGGFDSSTTGSGGDGILIIEWGQA